MPTHQPLPADVPRRRTPDVQPYAKLPALTRYFAPHAISALPPQAIPPLSRQWPPVRANQRLFAVTTSAARSSDASARINPCLRQPSPSAAQCSPFRLDAVR